MKNVTIFGGSGFVGSYVVRELAKAGYVIKIVSKNAKASCQLKLCGNLGQIIPVCGNVLDSQSIDDNITGADAVINLVGILTETKDTTFEEIHHKAAKNIAESAQKHGVKKLVHFSALTSCGGSTKYGASKLRGEKSVISIFPDVIIIKPSVIFGEEDRFFNLFAKIAKMFRILPLIAGGKAMLQPVYVGDVAKSIAEALENEDLVGGFYNLVGPKKYSLKELMLFVRETLGMYCFLMPVLYSLAMLQAWSLEWSAWKPINKFITGDTQPMLTRDQVRLLCYDNVSDENGLLGFNIIPTPIEEIVPKYLKAFYNN